MIKSEALSEIPWIQHGFFTRQNGFSQGVYQSLNCSFLSKDMPEDIQKNRDYVAKSLGKEQGGLFTCKQVHKNHIYMLEDQLPEKPPEADGVLTMSSKYAIGVLTADCAPILCADRKKKIVGAIHSGWKGTVLNIPQMMIKEMIARGSNPKDIVAVVGPSIGPDSYEVDQAFKDRFVNVSDMYEEFFVEIDRPEKYLFDLHGIIMNKLEEFPLAHIDALQYDTYADEEMFFSYRRAFLKNEPDFGRQVAAIAISP